MVSIINRCFTSSLLPSNNIQELIKSLQAILTVHFKSKFLNVKIIDRNFSKIGEEISLKDVLDAISKQSADLKKGITDFKQEMLTSIGATVSEHTAKINNIEKQIEEIDEKVLKSEIEKR